MRNSLCSNSNWATPYDQIFQKCPLKHVNNHHVVTYEQLCLRYDLKAD